MLLQIREHLNQVADSSKALGMQKYMKSAMPYLGVSRPKLRIICQNFFSTYQSANSAAWQKDVLNLWNQATYREERYAAIFLTGLKQVQLFQNVKALPLYEKLILSGAWWDYVDEIATHRLSQMILQDPKNMKTQMLLWSQDNNLWKRRSSILCQIPLKKKTDLKFLYDCIAPSLSSKEFFLRKAIGWALRQYAWVDPKEIKQYVKNHETQLSHLSKREALKNIRSD